MKKKENNVNTIKILWNKYFNDDKKRKIATLVLILPFLIIIGICGFITYKKAKELIAIAQENPTVNNEKYRITVGADANSYVLRDNATNIQKEYFAALKSLYENTPDSFDKEEMASLIVKNYVADFYTWSNKQGQYDVGGMYYVFTPQRYDIYIQARDQFYKYLNNYINDYGVNSLLEVENVETTTEHIDDSFIVTLTNEETGEEYETELNTFYVTANWSYVVKENNFNSSKYNTTAYFVVVDNCGRYEITYAGNEVYHAE